MMKKLLALLMALILPAAALAQASCTEWMLTVDEELCAKIYADSGLFGGEQSQKLCAALAKVMNGLGVRVTSQEDGGALEVVVGGRTLLDFTALERDGQLIITTDLAPGYGLTIPVQELSAEEAEMQALLAKADWRHLVSSVAKALAEAAQGIEVTTTRGSFSGDAYAGGVYCTTVMLDDSDVAALLSCVLTEDVRAVTAQLLEAMELDAEALLAEVDAFHQRVAQENVHQYVLRFVTDEVDTLVGGSAVVMRGREQLATLSVGLDEGSMRIVFGTGMGEQNYWLDLVIVADETAQDAVIALKGTIREFLGEKEEDFRMAAAVATEFLANTTWSVNVSPYQNGLTWTYSQSTTLLGGTVEIITCNGMTIREDTLICTAKFALNDAEYMTLSLSRRPCKPLAADHSDLTLCDMSAPGMAQEALLEEIGEKLGMNLIVRLLEVLPMDVLTMFLYN